MSFLRAPNPVWFFVDLVGLPLNDEYFAFFLTNTLPYLPQPVYQDPQGMTVWNFPLEFYPNGTLPDNLYFDPSLVYRIEIRHGNTQNDPLIYEINNFVPGSGSAVITSPFPILFAENQTSNNNFSLVNFAPIAVNGEPTLSITTAGTYSIAPDWDLVLTGVGTTTVKQKIYDGAGVVGIENSPNYALEIVNSGWTTAILRQRYEHNGAIFGGGAVNMSLLAQGVAGSVTLSMLYAPSTGSAQTVVPATSVGSGTYTTITGTINLADSTNSDLSTVAYTDLVINLPVNGTVDLTDVQFVGQNDSISPSLLSSVIPAYQQETEERKLDHLFHYYENSLLRQPKQSLLVGWNFALNPWQFRTTSSVNLANNAYTADQTIVIQQNYVASATGNNISVGRSTFGLDNFAIQFTAVTAHNQFAMLQYIDPSIARPYWGSKVSVYVKGFINTAHATNVKFKMRLVYKAGLPNTVSQTDPVASWTEGSDPVAAAGYTFLAPVNDPTYIIDSANSQTIFTFDGITLPQSSSANMTLGLMIYTVSNMDQTATADILFFNDVSLTPNDFAIASPNQTADDVLRECQFYWEQSYDSNNPPNTSTSTGLRFAEQLVTNTNPINLIGRSFSIEFNTVKRIAPIVHLYSAVGTGDAVSGTISNGGAGSPLVDISISNWTANWVSTKSIGYVANDVSILTNLIQNPNLPEGFIVYHYTLDSRLGV